MKANVSIPDPLWAEALAQSTVGVSPSAVLQDALRRSIALAGGPSELDEEATELFEAARQSVRADAEKAYSRGYKAGLRLARDLTWDQLREMVATGVETALEAEKNRVVAEFEAGIYPDGKGSKGLSPFAVDERKGEDGGFERDEDDHIVEDDPHNVWGREMWIDYKNVSFVAELPDPHFDPADPPQRVDSLFVRGTNAALRHVLSAATPE